MPLTHSFFILFIYLFIYLFIFKICKSSLEAVTFFIIIYFIYIFFLYSDSIILI